MMPLCDVTNSVYPVTMTTIRHYSILEFGRRAYNQAVAPRTSPDLCTPLFPPNWCLVARLWRFEIWEL